MAEEKTSTDRKAHARRPPPLWRLAFDLVERPIAAASEAWVQREAFMDALAVTWRLQRRATQRLQRGVGLWLNAWDVPTRHDVLQLVNQVASLERQVREVARELERRDGAARGQRRPAATARRTARKRGGG